MPPKHRPVLAVLLCTSSAWIFLALGLWNCFRTPAHHIAAVVNFVIAAFEIYVCVGLLIEEKKRLAASARRDGTLL